MSRNKIIDVAVGVLCNDAGEVLFAQRPAGKPMAGYWEFPGGKLEMGETVHEALVRELYEELGVHIGTSMHWQVVEHTYPHAHVLLHFQVIRTWTGNLHGCENQALSWQKLHVNNMSLPVVQTLHPILPATEPLLHDLAEYIEGLTKTSSF